MLIGYESVFGLSPVLGMNRSLDSDGLFELSEMARNLGSFVMIFSAY